MVPGALLLILAGSVGSCTDLSAVDRDVAKLIDQRSGLLGPESRRPERVFGRAENAPDSSIDTAPPSTNPSASELRFNPADEARDVEARLNAFAQPPADPLIIDLPTAWRQTQKSAREYLNAEEDYILASIRTLIARHGFDLQLFGSTSATVTSSNTPADGNEATPLRVLNELGLTQRLPDGGSLAARLIWDATDQLRQRSSGTYEQASRIVLSGEIPLLRGAGISAREDLIQAERDLVYAARTFEDFRRSFLVTIARDYFALVQQAAEIRNIERQLASLRQLETRTQALVEAGRVAEFERNIASNRVLQAVSSLARARENFLLATDRFKVRLGMDVNQPVAIAPFELATPEPDITPEDATRLALDYRLDLQTRRDRVDDARRIVEVRKNSLLPEADLFGSATFRNRQGTAGDPAPRIGGFVYEPEDTLLIGGIRVDWGLDRRVEQLTLRQATIQQQQRERDLSLLRDNIVVDVRSRVREIDRARFALKLAEEAVVINRRRLEEQELKRDEVTAQQFVETENDLLNAENARDQAKTDLRNAVLNYLLASGQLRVARDGTLEMLPGMSVPPAPEAPAPPAQPEAPAAQPAQP
jgi:outer membrane protein TolC